jgi:hypothetical protein
MFGRFSNHEQLIVIVVVATVVITTAVYAIGSLTGNLSWLLHG